VSKQSIKEKTENNNGKRDSWKSKNNGGGGEREEAIHSRIKDQKRGGNRGRNQPTKKTKSRIQIVGVAHQKGRGGWKKRTKEGKKHGGVLPCAVSQRGVVKRAAPRKNLPGNERGGTKKEQRGGRRWGGGGGGGGGEAGGENSRYTNLNNLPKPLRIRWVKMLGGWGKIDVKKREVFENYYKPSRRSGNRTRGKGEVIDRKKKC